MKIGDGVMAGQGDVYGLNTPRRVRRAVRWRKVSTAKETSQDKQHKDALKRLSVDIDGELLFKFRQITLGQRTTIREEITRFVEDYVEQYEEERPTNGDF